MEVPHPYFLRYGSSKALQWRHNERDGVSNHHPRDCLLNRLFKAQIKETSKLRVTGLCDGNSPKTGEFPAQRASNAFFKNNLLRCGWMWLVSFIGCLLLRLYVFLWFPEIFCLWKVDPEPTPIVFIYFLNITWMTHEHLQKINACLKVEWSLYDNYQ